MLKYKQIWHGIKPTRWLIKFNLTVFPAGHFPQKSLGGNSIIGFPLLLTARPYPFLPLTHGPPLLYWLGTSGWCLSLMHAPVPYVSIACLLFTRLPWPRGLSGLYCLFCHSFLTSCSVDELLGLRSLYLTFSMSWVLLGHWLMDHYSYHSGFMVFLSICWFFFFISSHIVGLLPITGPPYQVGINTMICETNI